MVPGRPTPADGPPIASGRATIRDPVACSIGDQRGDSSLWSCLRRHGGPSWRSADDSREGRPNVWSAPLVSCRDVARATG
jgi:hypothetical protein